MIPTGRAILRSSPPKSVPLDFGLDKTFALYFYHHTTIHPNNEIAVGIKKLFIYCHSQHFIAGQPLAAKICKF